MKEQERIIHLTLASTSGAALYVYNLVQALSNKGFNVDFICPKDFDYIEHLNGTGVSVYPENPSPEEARGKLGKLTVFGKQASASIKIARKLKARGARMIHINFPGLHFTAVLMLLGLRLSGLKIVLTVHDVRPHHWLLPKILRFLEWSAIWAMYHLANALVVHHQHAKEILHAEFGIPNERISIIPHGEFSISDAPIAFPDQDTEITALAFGKLRQNKGMHLAIQAVQQLRGESYPIRLLIAGSTYASEINYWQTCKELIGRAPDGITVIEHYIKDDEVLDVIRQSHIFLLPYTDFFSQSGVALLGLSNGRPIVATAVGGIAELIMPGKTGIVISEPTVPAVKDALLQVIQMGSGQLSQMGRYAAEFCREHYSWESVAGKHLHLYNTFSGVD